MPNASNPQDLNRFAYVRNNPLRYTDPTGRYLFEEEPDDPFFVNPGNSPTRQPMVIADPCNLGTCQEATTAELIAIATFPIWVAGGGVVAQAAILDVGVPAAARFGLDVAIPAVRTGWSQFAHWLGIGGSAACTDLDCTNEVEAAFGGLSRASEFGIRTFRELRNLVAGTGLERHHIIEQRFAGTLGQNAREMLSVVLTPEEHQMFTNAWRTLIGYSNSGNPLNTLTATNTFAKMIERCGKCFSDSF